MSVMLDQPANSLISIRFWRTGESDQFAERHWYHVPRVGESVMFIVDQVEKAYSVKVVIWDADGRGVRIFV
jgi:hypothetical protein